MKRFEIIDLLRGFAVFLMIIFHFSYDLNLFGYIQVDFIKDTFWWTFPRVIVFLFMLSVGLSLCVVHGNKIKWKGFWIRFTKIAVLAALISVFTYFSFPQSWIYFGTLHSIAICSLICLPFLNYPKVSLLLAIALFGGAIFWNKTIPWILLDHYSMDYIPPFPWVGVCLLGVFLFSINFHLIELKGLKKLRNGLSFLGKHSLLIYILHQPILFGSLWIINRLGQI